MEPSGKQMSGYEDRKYHLVQAKRETHDHAVGHSHPCLGCRASSNDSLVEEVQGRQKQGGATQVEYKDIA